MPAHPGRSAFAEPGTSSEGWSPATLPVWRAGDENRAPDTLVEATFSAIADAGSIPAVSTGSPFSLQTKGFCGEDGGNVPLVRIKHLYALDLGVVMTVG